MSSAQMNPLVQRDTSSARCAGNRAWFFPKISDSFVGPEIMDPLVLGTVACVTELTLLEVPVAPWPLGISTHRTQRPQGKPLLLTGPYADVSNS